MARLARNLLLATAGLAGVWLVARAAMATQYAIPQFTTEELLSYMDANGLLNFDPAFKPAINSTETSSSGGFGLMGTPGLGFDWGSWANESEWWDPGAWGSEIEYWYPEDDIVSDVQYLDSSQLIAAVADHLKVEEGFRPYIYDDTNGRPWSESKKGNPTIGYGHLVTKQDFATYGTNWTVSEPEAYALLLQDVNKHLAPIIPDVKVPLTFNQWIAITSLAFNAGPNGVKRSRFLKAVNAQNWPVAEYEFKDWNKATVIENGVPVKKIVRGLVNRREREWNLFATPSQVVQITDAIYA